MEVPLFAAMITGGCTLSAPMIALLVKRKFEERKFHPISEGRRTALHGSWQGTVHQRDVDPSDYSLHATFSTNTRAVQGTVIFKVKDITSTLSLTGGFLDNRYLKLDYINQNPAVIHYGMMMFDFSANAREIKGEFLGYGLITERIVSGEIRLRKVS